MKYSLLISLLLSSAAYSETFEMTAPPVSVTIYSSVARVQRTLAFDAPAGEHRIVVVGLPGEDWFESLRIAPSDGVTVIASSLAQERTPATGDHETSAVKAAKDEVARREEIVAAGRDAIDLIRLRGEAAEAQIGYFNRLGTGGEANGPGTDPASVAATIGDGARAARADSIAARAEIRARERGQKDLERDLEKARQTLASLDGAAALLTLIVSKETDGPALIGLSTMTMAAWQPVYDVFLTRNPAPGLRIERGALIRQESGEDWNDVDLTLSTASIGEIVRPYDLFPDLASIESEEDRRNREARNNDLEAGGMAEPVMEPEIVVEKSRMGMPAVSQTGELVTYHYPHRITLRSDADGMRLALDTVDLVPEVYAKAVPRWNDVAYLAADVTNSAAEVILAGTAFYYADGVFRGTDDFPEIASGDHAEIGFGELDGVKVGRTLSNRSQGDRGFLAGSTTRDETAEIEIRNLTGEGWAVRVFDQVPYSEQDGLKVTYKATPPVAAENVDGKRGILQWNIDLKAGETGTIRLEHSLSWPAGMVLR
jgi:uncharacterized protein (TIGR02231 family)